MYTIFKTHVVFLKIDSDLPREKYKVCSCVPKDKYDKTSFQPWLTTREEKYKQLLP